VDHSKLLRNAVLWATNEPVPISVEVKCMLDISILEQQDSMTVHLVNLTNPMMLEGPVREIVPISEQKISLRIPADRRVQRVHLLTAAKDVAYRTAKNSIMLEVPSIALHEVVAVDFSA